MSPTALHGASLSSTPFGPGVIADTQEQATCARSLDGSQDTLPFPLSPSILTESTQFTHHTNATDTNTKNAHTETTQQTPTYPSFWGGLCLCLAGVDGEECGCDGGGGDGAAAAGGAGVDGMHMDR